MSCILFHFYIKPQHCYLRKGRGAVVSYSISTSNHNIFGMNVADGTLYLIPFLHQTTTKCDGKLRILCCILFHFYIKPQHLASMDVFQVVVSYSISTSNHNVRAHCAPAPLLYLIPFLHQTTTMASLYLTSACCILFHFYIKPQLTNVSSPQWRCCILFHFYIKPQPTFVSIYRHRRCILFHFYIKPQLLRLQPVNR